MDSTSATAIVAFFGVKGLLGKKILSEVSKWSYDQLKKNFTVYKILNAIGVERPKDHFGTLYWQTIIIFSSTGKKSELIDLILSEDAQKAFKREKQTYELGAFIRQLDHDLHTSPNLREIKHWNEIPIELVEEFFDIYEDLVTSIQSPVETKIVAKLDELVAKTDRQAELIQGYTKIAKETFQPIQPEIDNSLLTLSSVNEVKLDQNNENPDSVQLELARQMKRITQHIDEGQISSALEDLNSMREAAWGYASDKIKFKILTNLGVCHFRRDNIEIGCPPLIEAYQYDPLSKVALSNISNAYLALSDFENALKYVKRFLEIYPESVDAYTCLIKIRGENESVSEIIEAIPENFLSNAEIIAALGVAYRKVGEFDKAIGNLEKAINLKPNVPEFEKHLLQVYLEKYEANFRIINLKVLDNPTKCELEKILDLINSVYSKLVQSDLAKEKARVLLSKAFILDCLSRADEAMVAIEQGLTLDPENVMLIKQKGIQLAFKGELEESISVLETIRKNPAGPEITLFMSEVFRNGGKYEEAIPMLEDFIEHNPDGYYLEQSKHILLDLYILAGRKDKISKFILENISDDSILNQIGIGLGYKEIGEKEKAEKILLDCFARARKNATFKERYFLAEALEKNGNEEQAIVLYETICDTNTYSKLLVRLIQLYQKTGRKGDTVRVMKSLRDTNGPIKGITEAEIAIYRDLGDYELARDISKSYVAKFPDMLGMQIRLNALEIRLENFAVVDAFLENEFSYWNLDTGYLNEYVAQLVSRNKRSRAFEVVYEYRRLKDNFEAHTIYMQLVLQFPLTQKENDDPEEVRLDTAVILKSKTGQDYALILEQRPSTELLDNEINPEHPKYERLIGKKRGDKIQFANSSQKWEVIQIMNKLKFGFLQSQIKSETIYAETTPFKSFHVDDFWEVIDKLGDKNYEENLTNAYNLYVSNQLPFGSLAVKLGKSSFELWDMLRHRKDIGFRTSPGNLNELQQSSSFLNEGKTIVLDVLSIITFHQLDLFPILNSTFGKMFITPSTYDEILEYQESTRSFQPEDYQNDKVIKILDEVKEYTKILIPQNILEMNSLEKDNIDSLLGKHFYDTVLLADGESAVLCSEDFLLRSLAFSQYRLETTWSHPVIWHLHSRGIISQEEYQDILLKLVTLNYRHTSIGRETLMHGLEKSNFKLTPVIENLFSILNGKNSSVDTATGVACHFLLLFMVQPRLSQRKKDEIAYFTLLSLLQGREVHVFFKEVNRFFKHFEIEERSHMFSRAVWLIQKQVNALQADFAISLVYAG